MPNYVEVISTEDEDEIIFVPYVKPPPPVIDIIEDDSSGTEENSSPSKSSSNSSQSQNQTPKKKKKKSSESRRSGGGKKICDNNNDAFRSTPKSNSISSTPSFRESLTPNNSNNVDENPRSDLSNGVAVNGIETIQSQSLGSLNNVATPSRPDSSSVRVDLDAISLSVMSDEPLPSIQIANSIFDFNEDPPAAAELSFRTSGVTTPKSSSAKRKSGGGRKARPGRSGVQDVGLVSVASDFSNDGSQTSNSNATGTPRKTNSNPKPRNTKRKCANERTNEEILNFLTTLGIPLETEDLQTLPPPKRIRKPKKKKDPPVTEGPVASSGAAAILDFTFVSPQVETASALAVDPASDPQAGLSVPVAVVNPPAERNEEAVDVRVEGANEPPVTDVSNLPKEIPSVPESTADGNISPTITRTITIPNGSPYIHATGPPSLIQDGIPVVIPLEEQSISSLVNDDVDEILAVVPSSSKSIRPSRSNDDLYPENFELTDQPVPYLPENWSQEMREFYDYPLQPLTIREQMRRLPDDRKLWRVRRLPPAPKNKQPRVRCLNCQQWGHVSRNCTEKRKELVCLMCGDVGHSVTKGRGFCRNGMCLYCGKKQATLVHGCNSCRTTSRKPPQCGICNVVGHVEDLCPDKWRRFHSTTSGTLPSDGSNEIELYGEKAEYRGRKDSYCSICGQKGHNYYYCDSTVKYRMNSAHPFHKPYIISELPTQLSLPASAFAVTRPEVRDRTVLLLDDHVVENMENQIDASIRIQITNNYTPAIVPVISQKEVKKTEEKDGGGWECMDYPDCKNKPSLGNSCHCLYIPGDHKLMLEAQKEGKLRAIQSDHTVAVTVLEKRDVIHIWGNNHVAAKEDLLRLINRLRRAQVTREKAKNKSTTTLTPDNTNKKKKRKLNDDGNNTGDPNVTPARPESPEIITLDDEEEEEPSPSTSNSNANRTPNKKDEILTIALLNSEWQDIWDESTQVDGLISMLTKTFLVDIFISKEDLTVTIKNGTWENRKIAQKNIVVFLESKAANVDFVMHRNLNDNHPMVPTIAVARPPPLKGKKFKQKQRLIDKIKSNKKRKRQNNSDEAHLNYRNPNHQPICSPARKGNKKGRFQQGNENNQDARGRRSVSQHSEGSDRDGGRNHSRGSSERNPFEEEWERQTRPRHNSVRNQRQIDDLHEEVSRNLNNMRYYYNNQERNQNQPNFPNQQQQYPNPYHQNQYERPDYNQDYIRGDPQLTDSFFSRSYIDFSTPARGYNNNYGNGRGRHNSGGGNNNYGRDMNDQRSASAGSSNGPTPSHGNAFGGAGRVNKLRYYNTFM